MSAQATKPQDLQPGLVPVSNKRPVTTFKIPKSLTVYGIATIGLVELTANEEIQATKRSNNNPMQLQYELVKESLREVDGRKVHTHDGSADLAFNSMNPKVRTLLAQAYASLHSPDDGDSKDFLSSQERVVG